MCSFQQTVKRHEEKTKRDYCIQKKKQGIERSCERVQNGHYEYVSESKGNHAGKQSMMTISYQSENLVHSEAEIINKSQVEILELENTRIKMKNSLQGTRKRFDTGISEFFGDRLRQIMPFGEHSKKKRKRKK
jgi:hypothetical protein